MYFDGSLKIDGARVGMLFISPNKDELRYVLRLHFPTSNNTAEYKACLHGMRIAVELGVKRLYVYGNWALVINQLNKDWNMTSKKMDAYYKEIRNLEGKFYDIEYTHVVQDKNKVADELSKLGSSRAKIPHGVFVQDLVTPSIKEVEDHVVEKPLEQQLVATVPPPITTKPSLTTHTSPSTTDNSDWRAPFIKYLQDGTSYTNRTENERLIRRSKQYILVDGILMRKNAKEEVLMKCITQEAGIKLLEEIHSGSCGNHAASRTLVSKAFRAGFYWPSTVVDAEKLVHHCNKCQFFVKHIRVLAHEI
jgi:ribonuclease HI